MSCPLGYQDWASNAGVCKAIPDECPGGYTQYAKDACGFLKWGSIRKCSKPCLQSPSCCTTGTVSDGLCHNDWSGLKAVCDPSMQTYCDTSKLFTDARCKTWCTQNSATCNNLKQRLCNTGNILNTDANCRNWCIENPGKCEISTDSYCKVPANKDSQFCSCINSPVRNRDIFDETGVPECFDTNCTRTGSYKTLAGYNQTISGCPDILKCYQTIDLSTVGGSINADNLDQTCTLGGTTTTPDATPDSFTFLGIPIIYIVFIFIFLIALIVGIIAVISSMKKRRRY